MRAPLPRYAKFMVSSIDVGQGKPLIQYTVPTRFEVARFFVDATNEEAQFRFGYFVLDNGEYKRKTSKEMRGSYTARKLVEPI